MSEALSLLLEASAHEILSRSAWTFRATPAQRAAAAAYLEWKRSVEDRARVYAAAVGVMAPSLRILRSYGWL